STPETRRWRRLPGRRLCCFNGAGVIQPRRLDPTQPSYGIGAWLQRSRGYSTPETPPPSTPPPPQPGFNGAGVIQPRRPSRVTLTSEARYFALQRSRG